MQLTTDQTDPDELFTRHTVSEVKFIQNRLRADADAKQEELRIMVGERYRDLLQASSSIIAISQSAKRVVQALEDSKAAILSQEEPPLPKEQVPQGSSDSHLRALQLLSAHMKLLLDAPEHLWRLIEKRKYFTAAWLFRLSIVVHRSLVNDEGGEWNSQGLDVLEQFPLIQRQLDSVNQFRQPIVHKAVQSLREYSTSVEDVCAALLPLNLLNSQPLGETFEVLLDQRSKTLNTMLLGKPISSSPVVSRRPNGHTLENDTPKSISEIRSTILAALDNIAQTVHVSRILFQDADDRPSLMFRMFEYIQSDSVEIATHNLLPQELQLTTHSILMSLPSSTHFLLLPHNVRAYKPSVPQKFSESPSSYTTKLGEWFSQSIQTLQSAVDKFFLDLRTAKDVWHIRFAVRKWNHSSPCLDDAERARVDSMLDQVCRDRVLAIWQLSLSEAHITFRSALDTALVSIKENTNNHRIDISPVDFLFESPPLPVMSQGGAVSLDSSFTRYKSALRKQLLGRTSLLDDVLKTLENCAKTIQQDFSQVLKGENDDVSSLGSELSHAYQPFAESLCTGILDKLESALVDDDTHALTQSIIFVGRVANELSSSSPFINKIGCNEKTMKEFQQKGRELHDKLIDRWRNITVAFLVDRHCQALQSTSKTQASAQGPPSGPSLQLIQSLISLSKAVQDLGILYDTQRYDHVAKTALHQFITQLVGQKWDLDDTQTRHDLALLRRFAELQQSWKDTASLLDSKAENLPAITEGLPDPPHLASDYLARTQTLFTPLLPMFSKTPPTGNDKYGALLSFGQPQGDQQFTSTLQIARPSPRFGLLPVGGGSSR